MINLDQLASDMIEFMKERGLARGTISDGCGNSVTVIKDKHGFYKTKITKLKENV